MIIKFFAGLKDFFGTEIKLDSQPNSINDLNLLLCKLNPEASQLISISRFAANNVFLSENSTLKNINEVLVMPPSSGG